MIKENALYSEKYRHGSHDSLDEDMIYIFHQPPKRSLAQSFCLEKTTPLENRNIVVLTNGLVSYTYKGTIDEINNSLYHTIPLHNNQKNPIQHCVKRDIFLKVLRMIRGTLSHFSRTEKRNEIKKALVSHSFQERYDVFKNLPYKHLFHSLKTDQETLAKFLSFQFGQTLGLLQEKEFYTKTDVWTNYPSLKESLQRKVNFFSEDLHNIHTILCQHLENISIEEKEKKCFVSHNGITNTYNVKEEKNITPF